MTGCVKGGNFVINQIVKIMKKNVSSSLLLALGILLIAGSHMTISIGILAWIAYVPFLLYLFQTNGWKSRLWFFLAYLLAWSLAIFKIVTDPIPVFIIPMYSIPIALFHLPAFLLWDRMKGKKLSIFLFPSLMVIVEWIQYTLTPLGSWGVAAYSQMDHTILLQSVSLFGIGGLSFLIYWVNLSLVQVFLEKHTGLKKIITPLMVLSMLFIFGALRYNLGHLNSHNNLRVAAVGTDSQVGAGSLPTTEIRRQNAAILFERTRKAARIETDLIVWNEGAAMVLPEEEPAWQDSLASLAVETQINLVASFVVLLSESPVKYENKYLFIEPNGTIAATYLKREPVPGEPAVKGKEPSKMHYIKDVKVAGAICYDYDFPYIAQSLGKQQVDLVALPSSDWRGIDPIHTKMAAFRAIEQGHSILRSTRFGLSAAINPYGEMVAQMSSFDENDKIMQANLPKKRAVTLFSLIGDVLIYACIAFVLWFWINTNFSYNGSVFPKSALNNT